MLTNLLKQTFEISEKKNQEKVLIAHSLHYNPCNTM